MMAAAKKGTLKKKRSDPTRTRRPDPDPSPPPPETRRSLRPRQTRYLADFEDELDLEEEEERERESKERRKLKLVLKLPPISTVRCRDSSPVTAPQSSHRVELDRRTWPPSDYSAWTSSSATSSSSRSEEEEEEIVKPLKKRRVERVRDSDGSGNPEERRGNVVQRPIRAVSGTPMPKRKTLEEILDKLQKKDTYGVFAEPVDPEELPDYHDVIEHPMDFGTVRRKLATRRYRSFEQFEDDVFLICSNAMQYNAPDTIYFRQARSIQDMARRNFQEVRADLISNGAEGESEEIIKSASNEKNTVKKLQCGIAPRPSGFDISSEKKTLRQPCGSTLDPLERETLKKQYRTTDPQGSDISSMGKRTLKKPQHRTAPEPPGSDISSMEKKILKKPQYRTAQESRGPDVKPQYRTAQESRGPDVSSMEKKTIRKLQNITVPEPQGSDVSSMEKKTINKLQNRTALEPRGSDVSSMEKKTIKNPQFETTPKPPDFDISSIEKKTVKKPQRRTTHEPLGSDISCIEKTAIKNPQHRTEHDSLCSDISYQDKKRQKEHQSQTALESLGSDNSDATLASVADAFTGLSKKPADSNASATDPCTGFSTAQPNGIIAAAEPCFGLTAGKAGAIERSVTINGFVDGNASLGESKSEKADEVPAKCSPSKLAMKAFVVDMNRRATYNTLYEQPVVETDSVFDVFEGETRQLHAVGLNSEYSYARSLARFAASLGPIAWEIASKKIEQALPPGVKFGPGWVGEYEPLLTPVLSIENSTQQQMAVTRKDKGNVIKSEASSTMLRKDKGNEITSEVSNGQRKDLPFGLKSQLMTGRPSSEVSNPLNEGRDRTQEQKQGLFGVNLELHPCTSRMTRQQQKNQPAGDLARAYTNETAGRRLDICSEGAKSTSPAIISHGWNHVQTEVQKLQQQNNQVAQMQVETQKQLQKKNKVAGDFAKAYTNETARQQPELYSEPRTDNFPATSYLGRSEVQTDPVRQPEAVTSQRRNDGLGMNVGSLSNWKSCDSRQTSLFGIISNHQAGVQYWHARGSQEQAVNDPLRWMSSSGKLSNQPNTSNRCSNNLEQSMPAVQIPKRENPNAATSQAWMSIGASAEWKSVDGGLPTKHVGPASFNPTCKNPSPASRAHEEANIRPEPNFRPEALHGVTENSPVQTKGLVIFPQLMTTDLSRLRSPWQGLVQHSNKQKDSLPPDLNISFQPPGSPAQSSSGILIDSQQPDLALQL